MPKEEGPGSKPGALCDFRDSAGPNQSCQAVAPVMTPLLFALTTPMIFRKALRWSRSPEFADEFEVRVSEPSLVLGEDVLAGSPVSSRSETKRLSLRVKGSALPSLMERVMFSGSGRCSNETWLSL